jgi:hypothetical protein
MIYANHGPVKIDSLPTDFWNPPEERFSWLFGRNKCQSINVHSCVIVLILNTSGANTIGKSNTGEGFAESMQSEINTSSMRSSSTGTSPGRVSRCSTPTA